VRARLDRVWQNLTSSIQADDRREFVISKKKKKNSPKIRSTEGNFRDPRIGEESERDIL
jgi:hypothetical protein